ncbi:MAG: tRNA (guanine(46)-N(7))-methyltransferase TrmB [Pseudomonadota bacterium]
MSRSKPEQAPWRNFYGRHKGKALRPAQERDISALLPKVALPNVSWDENPERATIDLSGVFGQSDVWLEIGFGGGEHLAHLAEIHPDVGLIGCEPYVNGVAMMLGKIRTRALNNVRIFDGDARDVFDVLAPHCIDRVYLLYPDPWPKTRHHRRRFVNKEFIDPLAAAMKLGAELRIATDIEDYVRQTLDVVGQHEKFKWRAERPEDWRMPWDNWTPTRYEKKALREGRKPHYLRFERV